MSLASRRLIVARLGLLPDGAGEPTEGRLAVGGALRLVRQPLRVGGIAAAVLADGPAGHPGRRRERVPGMGADAPGIAVARADGRPGRAAGCAAACHTAERRLGRQRSACAAWPARSGAACGRWTRSGDGATATAMRDRGRGPGAGRSGQRRCAVPDAVRPAVRGSRDAAVTVGRRSRRPRSRRQQPPDCTSAAACCPHPSTTWRSTRPRHSGVAAIDPDELLDPLLASLGRGRPDVCVVAFRYGDAPTPMRSPASCCGSRASRCPISRPGSPAPCGTSSSPTAPTRRRRPSRLTAALSGRSASRRRRGAHRSWPPSWTTCCCSRPECRPWNGWYHSWLRPRHRIRSRLVPGLGGFP